MNEAKVKNKIVTAITPNYCGQGVTEWRATPKENGAVELTYQIKHPHTVKSAPKEEPQTFPQIGDTFYRINSQGKIIAACWVDDQKQHNIKEYGNVFKTEAEAEEALEKIKGVFKK